MKKLGFVFILLIFVVSGLQAATYQVGPGRTYTDLQSVTSLLQPGDVVEVDGNAIYPGGVVFTESGTPSQKITIRGIRINGNRPVISGGTTTVHFRTPWPYTGGADHYIFEGFEVTGGSSYGIVHQGDQILIRDVAIHDCARQGLLGTDLGSGSLTLEYVEIYRCGEGVYRHQIYMATDEANHPGSVFRMQNCYIHDGNGGNNVKSRAERNEIYYNWIEGALYSELEMIGPDGADPNLAREDSDVVGNVFVKTRDWYVTRVGGDGTGETNGRYRFVNNIFICANRAVFTLFDGIESIQMHNNVFYHYAGGTVDLISRSEVDWTTGSEIIAGSNNWVPTGAVDVPSQWIGTVTGNAPGFRNFASLDVRPDIGSPLIGAGNESLFDPPGYPFPSPLFPPGMHPPLNQIEVLDSAEPRPVDGMIDIGAFEAAFGPEMDIRGNGISISNGDPTPSAIDGTDFGMTDIDTGSTVHTFTILNTGPEDLTLSGSVQVGGDHAWDFTVSANPVSPIVQNGDSTFQVTFDPLDTGLRKATITIDTNDLDENPYVFSIQGTGTTPITGDLNFDMRVDLTDVIIALQVAAGMMPNAMRDDFETSSVDVGGDNHAGLKEAIYGLQVAAQLR